DCRACRRLGEEYRSLSARMRELAERLPAPGPEIERRSIERWLADREPAGRSRRCQPLMAPVASPIRAGKPFGAVVAASVVLIVLVITLGRWLPHRAPARPPLPVVQRPGAQRPARVPAPVLPLLRRPSDRRIAASPLRVPLRAGERARAARPPRAG